MVNLLSRMLLYNDPEWNLIHDQSICMEIKLSLVLLLGDKYTVILVFQLKLKGNESEALQLVEINRAS